MERHDSLRSVLRRKGDAVWSIDAPASVYDAIALMSERHIGALLVLDEEGKLAGIISERDYARKVILKGRSSKDTEVREIMTTPVVCVTPEATVDQGMQLMTHHRIRHLPVMEGDRIVGVISIGDLVRWTISAQEETIHHLNSYITASYPA
ncbi:MAG: CBS domain-containing protein [Bryobacterales bacterium]|nr:CBS domain-containing protein [Bryobacterales bacterium]